MKQVEFTDLSKGNFYIVYAAAESLKHSVTLEKYIYTFQLNELFDKIHTTQSNIVHSIKAYYTSTEDMNGLTPIYPYDSHVGDYQNTKRDVYFYELSDHESDMVIMGAI